MKFLYYKLFIILLIFFLFQGCVNTPKKEEKHPCWITSPRCIKHKFPYSAVGIGKSTKEALNDALRDLASQKGTFVSTSTEEKVKDIIKDNKNFYSEDLSEVFKLKSEEYIKFRKIIDEDKVGNNFFVLVAPNQKIMDSVIDLKYIRFMLKEMELHIRDVHQENKIAYFHSLLIELQKKLFALDFNLLKNYDLLKNNESKAILKYRIQNFLDDLETEKEQIRYFKNMNLKMKKNYVKMLQDKWTDKIIKTCTEVKKHFDIEIINSSSCRLFLSTDKRAVCTKWCGDAPTVLVNKSISFDNLRILKENKDVGNYFIDLFNTKQKLLLIKSITNY